MVKIKEMKIIKKEIDFYNLQCEICGKKFESVHPGMIKWNFESHMKSHDKVQGDFEDEVVYK